MLLAERRKRMSRSNIERDLLACKRLLCITSYAGARE